MCLLAKFVFAVLLIYLRLSTTAALRTEDPPQRDLEPQFEPFPGNRRVGGCTNDLTKLRIAYYETIQLATGAKEALDLLCTPIQDLTSDKRAERDRIAVIARSLFGISVDEFGVNPGQDTNLLLFVKSKSHDEYTP